MVVDHDEAGTGTNLYFITQSRISAVTAIDSLFPEYQNSYRLPSAQTNHQTLKNKDNFLKAEIRASTIHPRGGKY